ncbi:MAG: LuxR family transcriptional regulator [Alphaproteobacteria bacterium]|nr:LuxR family transcriptional regulator [Alphaproteobacteria bacterium]
MAEFQEVQEFVRQSREVADLDVLKGLVESISREFGFTYFLLAHHVNLIAPNYVQLSNYPEDWSNEMRRQSQFAADPVLRACQKTAAPFQWSEIDRLIKVSPAQRDILRRAAHAGIGPGFTVPVHIPGECTGSGSFAVAAGRELNAAAMPYVQFVTSFGFEAARKLCLKAAHLNFNVADVPGLTPRQLDCIVLMAQGKSDWTVGRLLGLSQRTVQEHIDNARKKYGVGSRHQLIVRTLFDNQLGFEDIIRA